jgi:hypothetical protein
LSEANGAATQRCRSPLHFWPRIIIALILALVIDWWVTIEWSWPDCGSGDRWVAAYGLPLPYMRWGGASSMEYRWVPEIFALNIGLLSAGIFMALCWLPSFRLSGKVYGALITLAALSALFNLLMLSATIVSSGRSLARADVGESMWDLRPVALRFAGYRRYECTPSPYWFGERRLTSGFPARPEPATRFP